MTFKDLNLNSSLLKALDDLGLSAPTPIQQKVFPVVMSGQDVCGIAQTGTGKTFAYLLPVLRQWKFSKEPFPQVLILVPTRELVLQVTNAIKQLCTYMSVVAIPVFGGVNIKPQLAAAENGCDIVVATPGRLLDLVLSGSLKLKSIKKFIIDEMDEMLQLGFRSQVIRILDLLPTKKQSLLFSATITEEVELMMEEHFRQPQRVEAAPAGTPLEQIAQKAYLVPNFYTKVYLLELLLSDDPDMSKVVVFTATRNLADKLYEQIADSFPDQVGVIHSNKEQKKRFSTVQQFMEGKYRVLIATDIVARGIDISGVSHVINFDLPPVPEHYIHRIGRTGRAEQKGTAISFITDKETALRESIEALMQYPIPELPLPENLEISAVLTEEEQPRNFVPNIRLKLPSRENAGAAFHEKLPKNKKVNNKISHTEKMRKKYGKPITRGAKPKR